MSLQKTRRNGKRMMEAVVMKKKTKRSRQLRKPRGNVFLLLLMLVLDPFKMRKRRAAKRKKAVKKRSLTKKRVPMGKSQGVKSCFRTNQLRVLTECRDKKTN